MYLYITARLLIAALFAISAFGKLTNWKTMLSQLSESPLPFPSVALSVAVFIEVFGTVMLCLGFLLPATSMVLIVYVVGASAAVLVPQLLASETRSMALMLLSNNFAIVGGLVLLLAVSL